MVSQSPNWEVEVRNFQSIKHAKIEIVDGLNIITGKTNSGKSAIFRSINSAIFNTGTDDLVQAGQDIASVSISNGTHSMSYARRVSGKNEKTAYKFDDGKVIRKVGRTQLPEVAQMFGIKEVQMQNNVKVRLNFWYQNEKPFLTDKTSGQLFEFLSLSSADKYFKILKTMKADIKIQEAEINNSNTTIDTLKMVNNQKEDFLKNNQGFNDVYTQIITAGAEADKANKLLGVIETLSKLSAQIQEVNTKLQSTTLLYDSIPMSYITGGYNNVIKANDSYASLYRDLVALSQTKKSLGVVKENLSNLEPTYNNYESAVKVFGESLVSIDTLGISLKNMETLISRCHSLGSQLDKVNSQISSLSGSDINLEEVNKQVENVVSLQEKYTKVSGMVNSLSNIKTGLETMNNNILGVSRRLEAASSELEEFKLKVGYCPFCGSVFRNEEVHSH